MTRKILVLVALLLVAGAGTSYWLLNNQQGDTPTTPFASKNTNPKPTPTEPDNLAPTPEQAPQLSIDEPSSLWVVVNKRRPLPASYAPSGLVNVGGHQLRSEAATALQSLQAAAKANGATMYTISGYRSYANQSSVYNNYVKRDGQAKADTYSARPGHSEHQTGLVMDLGNGTCDLEICFGNTTAGKWLAAHAHEYGFIIRYPDGKTAVTGYQYEPWHVRYVGTDLAAKIYNSGKTLEEYFNLPAAPNY